VGVDHNYHLVGHTESGRYQLRGNRINGLSGPLAADHEWLKIQAHDLALMNSNGAFTGIGCVNPRYKPPKKPQPKTTIPLGVYSCYYTVEGAGGGYYSQFSVQLQLFGDGTYMDGDSPRYSSAWHQSGDNAIFTEGPLWSDSGYAHDIGTYYPSGVSMPHAESNVPASGYTLVIKDTRREGGIPPSQEWSSTDGPDGSHSVPTSFTYCKR
jgi:hypothetical protein